MVNTALEALVPEPSVGRIFAGQRRVRLADATSSGRLRLDACARYLQDVANDDSRDAGSENPTAWVARSTTIVVDRFPLYLHMVSMRTWCSGLGPRWAQRRYSVQSAAPDSGRIEASTLWVHVDMATMKPISVPADFLSQYAESALGRKVSARLHLPTVPPADATRWSFAPRSVDFDVLGHINNSVYWAMVEEELHRRGFVTRPLQILLEHHEAIEPNQAVTVVVQDTDSGLQMWVLANDRTAAAVRVMTSPSARTA